MTEYLYKAYKDNWNPIDTVLWVDPDGSMSECNDIKLAEVKAEIASYDWHDSWEGHEARIYKLVDGDYFLHVLDYETTLSSDRGYRAATLETIQRWCLSDEERSGMQYETV